MFCARPSGVVEGNKVVGLLSEKKNQKINQINNQLLQINMMDYFLSTTQVGMGKRLNLPTAYLQPTFLLTAQKMRQDMSFGLTVYFFFFYFFFLLIFFRLFFFSDTSTGNSMMPTTHFYCVNGPKTHQDTSFRPTVCFFFLFLFLFFVDLFFHSFFSATSTTHNPTMPTANNPLLLC